MSTLITLGTTRTWITDPTAPGGASVVCGSVQQSPTSVPLDGDIRHYAGGRTQGVVRDQDDKILSYQLVFLSPTALAQLIAWRGRTVLLRTFEAERVFAVYYDCPYSRALNSSDDVPSAGITFTAAVTFTRVSYTEAV